MMAILEKIWFLVAVLPFIIFLEASQKFADFLKKRNMYLHWDVWHSVLLLLLILLVILFLSGYR